MKGRKRHLVVDTQGFVLKALVHAADVQDRDGGRLVLAGLGEAFPTLRHLWVDAGYRGQFVDWVEQTLKWSVEVVQHWWTGNRGVWVAPGQEPPEIPAGFQVLPWRWIVERTQPHYSRPALDVHLGTGQDRAGWAAQPPPRGDQAASGPGRWLAGRWCAMPVPASSSPGACDGGPPRPSARRRAADGSNSRPPIAGGSCSCSAASSNAS